MMNKEAFKTEALSHPSQAKEEKNMPKEQHKEPASQQMKVCEACNQVSYEEFAKLDIRVAKVVKAEPHPNADKLVILLVDLGKCESQRQIVAGIRKHYPIEKLLGKK